MARTGPQFTDVHTRGGYIFFSAASTFFLELPTLRIVFLTTFPVTPYRRASRRTSCGCSDASLRSVRREVRLRLFGLRRFLAARLFLLTAI